MTATIIFIIFAAINILLIVMPLVLHEIHTENRFLYIMAIVVMVIGFMGTLITSIGYGWNLTPQSKEEWATDIFFALIWLSGYSILTRVPQFGQRR